MRTYLIISLLTFIASISYGQKLLYLEYVFKLKNSDEDLGQLIACFNQGNSINERSYYNLPNATLDLVIKDSANVNYRLSSNKTYMEMPDPQLAEYKVKYLRDETIDNSKNKVIEVATHDTNNFNIVLWISNEIMHYDTFMVGSVNAIDYVKLKAALAEENITGLPVIIQYKGLDKSIQYYLKSFGETSIDLSLFSLEGYTKQEGKSIEELIKEGKIDEEKIKEMQEQERIMNEIYKKNK